MNKAMKLKVFAVHVPPGIEDLPTIQVQSETIYQFKKSTDTIEGLNWAKADNEFNTRVVDRFISLLSEQNPEDIRSGDSVGLVWVYEPKSIDTTITIDYVQVVLRRSELITFFGSELAQESEIEFFEAV
jgi:hypothetical protein